MSRSLKAEAPERAIGTDGFSLLIQPTLHLEDSGSSPLGSLKASF